MYKRQNSLTKDKISETTERIGMKIFFKQGG